MASVACLAVAVLGGCSSDPAEKQARTKTAAGASADERVFPGKTWATAPPERLGLDPTVLDQIADEAEAGGSDCLTVVRHGKVAGSWYWNGSDADSEFDSWSVTKSFTSILVGLAQYDGDLDIGDPISKYIPELADTPSKDVTIENLLSNDSGRHWDFQTDYYTLTGADDRSAQAISLPQDNPPGTVWVYNNSAIQMLSEVLQAATGLEPADMAKDRIFEPIGMAHSVMRRDKAGNTSTYMGLRSTCEDLARFGLLMLRHGTWDGKQVVPAGWIEDATSRPSQELNAAYGYLFWLNRKGRIPVEPNQATDPNMTQQDFRIGQKHPSAPEDMFWALGLGDQIIQMDPGSDTVVVRMGPGQPPEGSTPFNEVNTIKVVTQAVTDGSH